MTQLNDEEILRILMNIKSISQPEKQKISISESSNC